MSLLIAKDTIEKLEEEQRRVKRNAEGESGGYIASEHITKDDLQELKDARDASVELAAKKKRTLVMPILLYTQAMVRDANYAVQGRKFMRAMSLNTRSCLAYNRAYALARANRELNKK